MADRGTGDDLRNRLRIHVVPEVALALPALDGGAHGPLRAVEPLDAVAGRPEPRQGTRSDAPAPRWPGRHRGCRSATATRWEVNWRRRSDGEVADLWSGCQLAKMAETAAE